MNKRFTFAVCVSCGAQSPPIIIEEDQPVEISIPLALMGWRLDKLRFSAIATCPNCLSVKKEKAVADGL